MKFVLNGSTAKCFNEYVNCVRLTGLGNLMCILRELTCSVMF